MGQGCDCSHCPGCGSEEPEVSSADVEGKVEGDEGDEKEDREDKPEAE